MVEAGFDVDGSLLGAPVALEEMATLEGPIVLETFVVVLAVAEDTVEFAVRVELTVFAVVRDTLGAVATFLAVMMMT